MPWIRSDYGLRFQSLVFPVQIDIFSLIKFVLNVVFRAPLAHIHLEHVEVSGVPEAEEVEAEDVEVEADVVVEEGLNRRRLQ